MSTYLQVSIEMIKASGLFASERIAEIEAAVEANRHPLFLDGGKAVGIEAFKGRDGKAHLVTTEINQEYYTSRRWQEAMTEDEVTSANRYAFRLAVEKKERENYEKAVKIPESEYSGWVVFGDTYADSASDLKEQLLDCMEEHELPEFAWAAAPQSIVTKKYVSDIFESDMCDRGWEDFDEDDLKGVKELQGVIDAFVESNADVVSYWPDTSRAIILDWTGIKTKEATDA